jgi:hypothetical protein
MYSPNSIVPKRLIPATVKVNRIRVKRDAVVKIFPSDIYSVLSNDLKPSDVLTILSNLETLIILSAVTLKFNYLMSVSSMNKSDMRTMMKSNLFQLTCQ